MNLNMKGVSCFVLSYLVLSGLTFASSNSIQEPMVKNQPNYVTKQVQRTEYKHVYKGERHYKDALPVKKRNHFEVIGALGIAKLNAGNSELGVTSSETDKLVQTNANNWNTFAAQLGVGYVYYFRRGKLYTDNAQWFPSIEPQLNLYQLSSNSVKGDVWRFNSSAFNQLKFDIPVHSTRLMLDAALTIVSKKQLSLFAIGGIGRAWNRVSYSDTDNGNVPCANQRLNLNSRSNSNFAWELGAGLNFAFNDRVGLSVEYLYTHLGPVKFSSNGSTGTITRPVIVTNKFNLNSQTALLGLHIALGKTQA